MAEAIYGGRGRRSARGRGPELECVHVVDEDDRGSAPGAVSGGGRAVATRMRSAMATWFDCGRGGRKRRRGKGGMALGFRGGCAGDVLTKEGTAGWKTRVHQRLERALCLQRDGDEQEVEGD